MKKPVKELDIGDPFDHFAKQAFRNATKSRFPIQFINEAIAIVRTAFGENWVRKMFEKNRGATPIRPLSKHPLADCFTIAGESQIAEVLELAIYLKKLAKVRNIDYVITQMKDKYYSGLLQLAYAYRFLRIGASELELEPPTSKGKKADIFLKFENLPCLVECYIPRSKIVETSIELEYSIYPIFDALKSKKGIYRVSIRLKKSIRPRDRKEIEKKVIELVNNINGQESVKTEDDLAEILIENISKMREETDFPNQRGPWKVYGGADWGVNQSFADLQKIQGIRDGLKDERKRGNRIFVWRPEAEKKRDSLEERINTLTKKISKKLTQVKSEGSKTKRIIIVSVGEGKHQNRDDLKICTELGRRIVIGHSNVLMLILTSRVWSIRHRHKYAGVSSFGAGLNLVPVQSLFKKLSVLEDEHDILEDWA